MKLLRYKEPVSTLFDLLGTKEDDMTFSLGLVASRSERFLQGLLSHLGVPADAVADAVIRLQTSDSNGRTDVELELNAQTLVILEAKRGPTLPTLEQLQSYVPRFGGRNPKTSRLVALTNTPAVFAATHLAALAAPIKGVRIEHLGWREVRQLAREARQDEGLHAKSLLGEFDDYLTEILGMENHLSNMVFVVSLGDGGPWGLNYKDVVTKRQQYFYPAASGWPSPPPNYVAFRFDGRLQSIHHVDSHGIFTNPSAVLAGAHSETIPPHYLCNLGPPMVAPKLIPTGPRIRRSARVWCMIDALLTAPTISAALDETERRRNEASVVSGRPRFGDASNNRRP